MKQPPFKRRVSLLKAIYTGELNIRHDFFVDVMQFKTACLLHVHHFRQTYRNCDDHQKATAISLQYSPFRCHILRQPYAQNVLPPGKVCVGDEREKTYHWRTIDLFEMARFRVKFGLGLHAEIRWSYYLLQGIQVCQPVNAYGDRWRVYFSIPCNYRVLESVEYCGNVS